MRSAQVLATIPSSECLFAISPSHAFQASWVEGKGFAAISALRRTPMRTPRSSRIAQCGRPPPYAWSAITSSLHAWRMRMRVSQSSQLVATLSFSTELRCRVLRRCCMAKVLARPSVSGSWHQRQRATTSFPTRSILATTLMAAPALRKTGEEDEGERRHDERDGGKEHEHGIRHRGQIGVPRRGCELRRGVRFFVLVSRVDCSFHAARPLFG